jgi:hypothetical protein
MKEVDVGLGDSYREGLYRMLLLKKYDYIFLVAREGLPAFS